MSCSNEKKVALAVPLIVTSLLLAGCSFGSSDPVAKCDGGACDCRNVYYGMEAGMYIADVPIEHASLHVTIPRVEPDQSNSTGCCLALYSLNPVREQGHRIPGKGDEQQVCNSCAKAPNSELANAAKSCASSDLALTAVPPRAWQQLSSRDEDMDGADKYSDCTFDTTNTVPFINGKSVTGIQSKFNIRWTDLKTSSDKSCCAAIQPLIRGLYFGNVSDAEQHDFCNNCKKAFNTGVGLAAFRLCDSVSLEGKHATADGTSAPTGSSDTSVHV